MAAPRSNDFQGPTDERPIVVTERNTAVPLGIAWVSVIGAITCTFLVVTTLNEINAQLEHMNQMLQGGWRTEHQREFAHRLSRDNPSLKVPDTYEIVRSVP